MRDITVVVKRNSFTPSDAIVGYPGLFPPKADMVNVSCVFTWDKPEAIRISESWKDAGYNINLGGPAFDNPGGEFIPGRFIKTGVTITSRGCPNKCPWCFVPSREGKIRELEIKPGNIVQDNNLLACNYSHLQKVFDMLKTQKAINFSGGFESSRITDRIVEALRGLRIYQLWVAYDHPNAEKSLIRAVNKLSKYFKRDKIRCYVLIGYNGDTLEKAEQRLVRAWEIGTLPFAMRYRTPKPEWNGSFLFRERPWNLLARKWTRPAIMKTMLQQKIITPGDIVKILK